MYQLLWGSQQAPQLAFISRGLHDRTRLSINEALADFDNVLTVTVDENRAGTQESLQVTARTLQVGRHDFRIRHRNRAVAWTRGMATPSLMPEGGVRWNGF